MLLRASVFMLLAACVSPQAPVAFTTANKAESALDTVSRALAAEGQAPASVDRQASIVHTEWRDTGFMYGYVQGATATIVRRFTVTIAPSPEGSNVTVRIDAKRCAQGSFTIGGADIQGTCEEATSIPGGMQKDLDALGAKLRVALGHGMQAAPPP
jgi:hypothetical protein